VKHLPNPHRQTPEQRIATLRNIWTYLNGLACEHHHDADLAIWQEITSANVDLYRAEKAYERIIEERSRRQAGLTSNTSEATNVR